MGFFLTLEAYHIPSILLTLCPGEVAKTTNLFCDLFIYFVLGQKDTMILLWKFPKSPKYFLLFIDNNSGAGSAVAKQVHPCRMLAKGAFDCGCCGNLGEQPKHWKELFCTWVWFQSKLPSWFEVALNKVGLTCLLSPLFLSWTGFTLEVSNLKSSIYKKLAKHLHVSSAVLGVWDSHSRCLSSLKACLKLVFFLGKKYITFLCASKIGGWGVEEEEIFSPEIF